MTISELKRKIFDMVIVFTVIVTIILWINSKDFFDFSATPFLYLGQISGLVGFVLLAYEYLFAARFRFIEKAFGGLDKSFKAHHTIGGLAFILILFHPICLLINIVPLYDIALNYLVPFRDLKYTLGLFALDTYLILLFITFFLDIPYHIWKWTHNLMGLPFLFAMIHVALITSDKSNSKVLSYWLILWASIATICYIYKRFLYEKFIRVFKYKITKLDRKGDIIEVYLEPLNSKLLEYYPGQYVFIKFLNKKLQQEFHPISISNSYNGQFIRLSIKTVGDYVETLKELVVNDEALVKGPYGLFGNRYLTTKREQIWIAGGIGVTPFLSMLNYEVENNLNHKINFFYCTNNESDAPYSNEILSQISKTPEFKYYKYNSDTSGHITAEYILKAVNGNPKITILLCGPIGMMKSLVKQFKALGIKNNYIIYEDFSFR